MLCKETEDQDEYGDGNLNMKMVIMAKVVVDDDDDVLT